MTRTAARIVLIDEDFKNVAQTRPGAHAAVIWTSEGFPVDNNGGADASARNIGTATLDRRKGARRRGETCPIYVI
jgi:hypothetical protein